MPNQKEILTTVGALVVAAGIGFAMQSSATADRFYGPGEQAQIPSSAGFANSSNALLEVEGITLTSAEFEAAVASPAAESQVIPAAAPQALPEPTPPATLPGLDCTVTADARAKAAAMVQLSMSAPCLPNERLTIHHNGMIFTQTTSAKGELHITVPALARDAVFILAFSSGDGAVAQTTVEDLEDFNRVVVQWRGDMGFQIHAREFGAAYGSEGHVWSGAPRDLTAAITGAGGYMTMNGDSRAADPLLAEVYTFPKIGTGRDGQVALSVEAEVTPANCGTEIEAQSLEIGGDGKIKSQDLTLAVPGCDAQGNFLVLNNLLQNLKVAQY